MSPRAASLRCGGFSGRSGATPGRGVSWLVLVLSAWVRLAAQPAGIPADETIYPPSPRRLAAVQTAAQRDGWAPQTAMLRAAALQAYEREKSSAAEAWFHVYRWSGLFGETEAGFVTRWLRAIEAARVGHPNMSASYPLDPKPLGAAIAPELQAWLVGNAAFSKEFFALLSPVDYLPNVFKILGDLHRSDPARFKANANLALAIAVVHDLPPPPIWPHGQVTAKALPREFAPPAEAFAWWIKQEQLGRMHHKLSRLGANELKFVVDAVAPLAELEWSHGLSGLPLGSLARAYTMVRYRGERATNNIPTWPGSTYKLPEILAAGGICADQAYFATQVGKARGVPTLFIYGAGDNGRHAWFGFLDGNQKWQLDAGRYAEQRLVTGYARDPQTWREFSDHELQFLSEHFRDLPSFRQSRLHALFAAEYLAAGNVPAAAAAARKAVNYERRNQEGWEILLAAAKTQGRDAKTIENLLREAALAFQRYRDLEAFYVKRVSESLRARGETSAADAEVARIAVRNRGDRVDLSVQQGRDLVLRAIATQPLAGQIRTYNSVVDRYGPGGGVGFFDQVVKIFVEHLLRLQQPAEASHALERARRILKVEPKSQLEAEFARLRAELKAPAR
ncbi:MAG: hypothetical protein HY736_14895 [Verrucomicrobia bacterium]|nr:hypothetical protein [Verrucomicrobiota bacterium]